MGQFTNYMSFANWKIGPPFFQKLHNGHFLNKGVSNVEY